MLAAAQTAKGRRNSVGGVKHQLECLIGAGIALGSCCMNAAADNFVPTVAEAHEFLADTFQRYPVSYVVRYGPDYGDRYKGWVAAYEIGRASCRERVEITV